MKYRILILGLVASSILFGFSLAKVTALGFAPSQEFGKQLLAGQSLVVAPVHTNSFASLDEPDDIQPAGGKFLLQRTANPQLVAGQVSGQIVIQLR